MTFLSPEVRDAFHRTATGTQVLLQALWTQVAKQGKFIEITAATESEIIIRITSKAETLSAYGTRLSDDET